MFDTLINIVFLAFGLLLSYDSYQKWQKNKSIWFLLSVICGVLAGLLAFSSWMASIITMIAVLVFRLIGNKQ